MQLKLITSVISTILARAVTSASYLRGPDSGPKGLDRALKSKKSKDTDGYRLTRGKFGRVSSISAASDPVVKIVLEDDGDNSALECTLWLQDEVWTNFLVEVEVVSSDELVSVGDVVGYVESGISQEGCDEVLQDIMNQFPGDVYSRVVTDEGEVLVLVKEFPSLGKSGEDYKDKRECQDDCATESCNNECRCLDNCDSDECEDQCKETCTSDCEREVEPNSFLKRWCSDTECEMSIEEEEDDDDDDCEKKDKPFCIDNNFCTTNHRAVCDDGDWICVHEQTPCAVGQVCESSVGCIPIIPPTTTGPTGSGLTSTGATGSDATSGGTGPTGSDATSGGTGPTGSDATSGGTVGPTGSDATSGGRVGPTGSDATSGGRVGPTGSDATSGGTVGLMVSDAASGSTGPTASGATLGLAGSDGTTRLPSEGGTVATEATGGEADPTYPTLRAPDTQSNALEPTAEAPGELNLAVVTVEDSLGDEPTADDGDLFDVGESSTNQDTDAQDEDKKPPTEEEPKKIEVTTDGSEETEEDETDKDEDKNEKESNEEEVEEETFDGRV